MNTSSPDHWVPDNGTPTRIWFTEGVSFAKANDRLPHGWWLKHPGWCVQVMGTSFLGWLFGSRVRHVLVETSGVCVDYGWTTTSVFKGGDIAGRYPGVIGWIEYATPSAGEQAMPDLPPVQRRTSTAMALLCNLVRLCTFGRVKLFGYRNCVDMAVALLEHDGIYLVDRPWHPRALLIELLEAQLEWHPRLSAGTASHSRGPDSPT